MMQSIFAAVMVTLLVSGSSITAQERPSYLLLSAPSITDKYYRPKFDQLIEFYAAFVKRQAPGDRIMIVADGATIAEIGNRLPRRHLLEGEARDIWIRDHGVIQTKAGIFKTRFRPNYLRPADAAFIENGFLNWFRDLGYEFTPINLDIDGGNFCHNGNDRAVVTDRILDDNPGLITELAILPEEAGDTTGHADGMVKWLSEGTIAVNDYTDRDFKAAVEAELRDSFPGVNIVTMPWNPTNRYWRSFADGTGVYVNAVTTPNAIYVPVYGLRSDDSALAVFRQHADRRVVPIRVSPEIAIMGGAARCLTCQVYGAPVEGKPPGAIRPVLEIDKLRPRDIRGRRVFVGGRARSSDGITSVHVHDGNSAKAVRLRGATGRWYATSRFPRGRSSMRLKVYAFGRKGGLTVKSKRVRRNP
jgi:agmatine deiminase